MTQGWLFRGFDHQNKPIDPTAGKHGGVETSREAFARADINGDCAAALGFVRIQASHGATAKEFAEHLGKPLNAVSGRFTTLKDLELIRPNGLKRDGCLVMVITGNDTARSNDASNADANQAS